MRFVNTRYAVPNAKCSHISAPKLGGGGIIRGYKGYRGYRGYRGEIIKGVLIPKSYAMIAIAYAT